MDKEKAMERLDAIEKEAKELRQLINKQDIMKYNGGNLYIATRSGEYTALILVGLKGARYFRWHSFRIMLTETGYGDPRETGEDALAYITDCGFDIHEFTDTREAFRFFLDNYRG